MVYHLFPGYGAHIQPDVLCAILLHLREYVLCNHVARLQLVAETVEIFIEQHGALAAHALRYQKPSALGFGIEGCGMNLNVIYMVYGYAVVYADCKRVAREYAEICGIFKNSSQPARGKHCIVGIQPVQPAVFAVLCNYAETFVALADYINHSNVGRDEYVAARAHLLHKVGGNLPARAVLVEADARTGMSALPRVCQRARRHFLQSALRRR